MNIHSKLRAALVSSFIFLQIMTPAQSTDTSLQNKKIVISQIINHPSLDLIVQGVVDELQKQGCQKENISLKNAQGNIATSAQISQKIASDQPDIVIAISTPSAQTAQKALQDTSIPLVFGGVTDPLGAKLVKNLDKPEGLITGTIDLPYAKAQIQLMKRLLPSLKTVGLIYNPSESNTVYQLDRFKEALAQENLQFIEATAAKTSDVKTAVLSIVKEVEALFIANDNTVVAAIHPLLKAADEAQIPVFTSDPESVEKGALGAVANDQKAVGQATGSIAVQILTGTLPSSIPVKQIEITKTYINQKTKEKLGL